MKVKKTLIAITLAGLSATASASPWVFKTNPAMAIGISDYPNVSLSIVFLPKTHCTPYLLQTEVLDNANVTSTARRLFLRVDKKTLWKADLTRLHVPPPTYAFASRIIDADMLKDIMLGKSLMMTDAVTGEITLTVDLKGSSAAIQKAYKSCESSLPHEGEKQHIETPPAPSQDDAPVYAI
jgi:hypothetical protein